MASWGPSCAVCGATSFRQDEWGQMMCVACGAMTRVGSQVTEVDAGVASMARAARSIAQKPRASMPQMHSTQQEAEEGGVNEAEYLAEENKWSDSYCHCSHTLLTLTALTHILHARIKRVAQVLRLDDADTAALHDTAGRLWFGQLARMLDDGWARPLPKTASARSEENRYVELSLVVDSCGIRRVPRQIPLIFRADELNRLKRRERRRKARVRRELLRRRRLKAKGEEVYSSDDEDDRVVAEAAMGGDTEEDLPASGQAGRVLVYGGQKQTPKAAQLRQKRRLQQAAWQERVRKQRRRMEQRKQARREVETAAHEVATYGGRIGLTTTQDAEIDHLFGAVVPVSDGDSDSEHDSDGINGGPNGGLNDGINGGINDGNTAPIIRGIVQETPAPDSVGEPRQVRADDERLQEVLQHRRPSDFPSHIRQQSRWVVGERQQWCTVLHALMLQRHAVCSAELIRLVLADDYDLRSGANEQSDTPSLCAQATHPSCVLSDSLRGRMRQLVVTPYGGMRVTLADLFHTGGVHNLHWRVLAREMHLQSLVACTPSVCGRWLRLLLPESLHMSVHLLEEVTQHVLLAMSRCDDITCLAACTVALQFHFGFDTSQLLFDSQSLGNCERILRHLRSMLSEDTPREVNRTMSESLCQAVGRKTNNLRLMLLRLYESGVASEQQSNDDENDDDLEHDGKQRVEWRDVAPEKSLKTRSASCGLIDQTRGHTPLLKLLLQLVSRVFAPAFSQADVTLLHQRCALALQRVGTSDTDGFVKAPSVQENPQARVWHWRFARDNPSSDKNIDSVIRRAILRAPCAVPVADSVAHSCANTLPLQAFNSPVEYLRALYQSSSTLEVPNTVLPEVSLSANSHLDSIEAVAKSTEVQSIVSRSESDSESESDDESDDESEKRLVKLTPKLLLQVASDEFGFATRVNSSSAALSTLPEFTLSQQVVLSLVHRFGTVHVSASETKLKNPAWLCLWRDIRALRDRGEIRVLSQRRYANLVLCEDSGDSTPVAI
ncbi:MAG: hypothetical protein MHM6MM_001441 [Cercozoa sp. M6MM]